MILDMEDFTLDMIIAQAKAAQLKKEADAEKLPALFDKTLNALVAACEKLEAITAERELLEAKLTKLDELATRFIEDSEEIAEYFDAAAGRNHLVLAKDIREIADAMADALNEQTANGGEHDWDLINQKLDDARMVDKQLLDKKANCQLDCGAYGSYCKCNDEHSKISSGQDAKDGAK
ncbi:hypothetical protein [Shewanella xiamenensis]|uniref:hypothetical protein n=1 Tax=Shewanella xiamenensis TaxID=332186 RepID=UPI00313CBC8C